MTPTKYVGGLLMMAFVAFVVLVLSEAARRRGMDPVGRIAGALSPPATGGGLPSGA